MSGPTRKDKRVLTSTTDQEKHGDLLRVLKARANGETVELPEEGPDEPVVDRDLLSDLLWIYKRWGGRGQLLAEVKTDPDIRKLFLSTLLKSGALSPAAKREKEKDKGKGGSKRGFLLVMKGLHDAPTEEKANSPIDNLNPLKPDPLLEEPMVDYDIKEEEEITVEGLDG